MTLDRAELTGIAAAVALHVALVAALSAHLARTHLPAPPAMEVEFVEDVGLQSAAPTPAPPPSMAPEQGEAPPAELTPPPPSQPLPPQPRVEPTPPPRPAERAAPAKTQARRPPVQAQRPARPAPSKPAPRVSRIGDDFLKGIADAPPSAKPAAAAPTFSASALAGIAQAIRRQVQPCADRQVNPGPGASRIRVRMRLQLSRTGRLLSPPDVLSTSGVDDENGRYEERVKDLAVAAFTGCAPLTGLPPELYKTADGRGWSNFIMNYNLP